MRKAYALQGIFKVGGGSVNFRRDAKTRSRAPTPAAVETFRGVTSILKETIRSTRTGHTDTDRPYSQKNVTAVQAPDETRLNPSCWAARPGTAQIGPP